MKRILGAATCLLILTTLACPAFAADRDGFSYFDLYTPDVQELLKNSYLGHQDELPDLNEPAVILREYLNFDSHAYVPPSADQIPELDQQIHTWQPLVHSYPRSRHALVGMARLYDIESIITHDLSKARIAADLYVQASQIAIQNGNIRYTSQIEILMVELNDPKGLDDAFLLVLSQSQSLDPIHYYQAELDYAQGLSAFHDPRADMYFSLATQDAEVDHTAAADLYANYLLSNGNSSKAFAMLSKVLTPSQRIRAIAPVFLRAQAARAAGITDASVIAETAEINQLFKGNRPGSQMDSSSDVTADVLPVPEATPTPCTGPPWCNPVASDDCRNPANAGKKVFKADGIKYYADLINMAEIEFNERGPGSNWGAVDAVGWTIRDRYTSNICKASGDRIDATCAAAETCTPQNATAGASWDGGCGWHTKDSCNDNPDCSATGKICGASACGPCSTLPIDQPAFSKLTQDICCADHGGTKQVGAYQYQMNDSHVDSTTLYNDGYVGAAAFMDQGYLPDMSVKLASGKYWTTSSINTSKCTFNCASPGCIYAIGDNAPPLNWDIYEESPNGPVEFLSCSSHGGATDPGYEYKASDSSQGWTGGNVCGGNNCFWNRCTSYGCSGP